MIKYKRILPKILFETLPNHMVRNLSEDDLMRFETETFKFLIKLTKAVEFNRVLRQYMLPEQIKIVKRAILHNYDCVIGFKLGLLKMLQGRQSVKDACFNFQLSGDYFKLLDYIEENDRGGLIAKTKVLVCKYRNDEDVNLALNQLIKQIMQYGSYFVYKKLEFIATSNNMDFKDISADLNEKAIAVFYNLIPFIDGEHLIRSIKRTIHNEGINMIKFYNAEKRKRLHSDKDGYHNNIITMDLVNVENNEGSADNNSYLTKSLTDWNYIDDREKTDKHLTVQNIVAIQSHQPRKKKILDLMMMKPDADFPIFAKQQGIRVKKDWNTEDLYYHIGQKNYLEIVCEYVDADKASFYKFIEGIRKELI
jgi:hypothetical protein